MLPLKDMPSNIIYLENQLNLRTKQSDYKVITKNIIDYTKSCLLNTAISKDSCLYLVRGDGKTNFTSPKYLFTKYLLREGWSKEQVICGGSTGERRSTKDKQILQKCNY